MSTERTRQQSQAARAASGSSPPTLTQTGERLRDKSEDVRVEKSPRLPKARARHIGNYHLAGEVVIGDPAYLDSRPPPHPDNLIELWTTLHVAPGWWSVVTLEVNLEGWGRRTVSLDFFLLNKRGSVTKPDPKGHWQEVTELGVDTARMSVAIEDCQGTITVPSGLGDGIYPLRAFRNRAGQVVYFSVDFAEPYGIDFTLE